MEVFEKEIPYIEPNHLVAKLPESTALVFFDSAKRSNDTGRYSFVAYDPFSIITCENGLVYIDNKVCNKPALKVLSNYLEQYSVSSSHLPHFRGGLAGYIGYEFSHYVEPKLNYLTKESLLPDLMLGVFDVVIAFDHVEKRCWIYSTGLPEKHSLMRKKRAKERINELVEIINSFYIKSDMLNIFIEESNVVSNFTYQHYCNSIKKVLTYIQSGDIYQANIAQRFECKLPDKLSSLTIYNRLREKNPAPFAAYLQFKNNVIASASPERFIACQQGSVTTSPIKGTSQRSSDPIEDKILAQTLFTCPKNRAENLMIVDLMRNDLSKVCELFSVKVPKLFEIESFATVHHLVSTITGKLQQDKNMFDLIAATFPGGSITGAPKIRAMQIINEIENTARGPYCGTIGYFGFDGRMDTSIVIRTFVIKNRMLSFHVGGGIVADSTPHNEYIETLVKANALYATLTGRELNFKKE